MSPSILRILSSLLPLKAGLNRGEHPDELEAIVGESCRPPARNGSSVIINPNLSVFRILEHVVLCAPFICRLYDRQI